MITSLIDALLRPLHAYRAARINQEAIRLWDRGEMAAVERLLRKALRICPTYARACSNLGTVLLEQNRQEEGMALLRKAVTLDPAYPGARVNLGIALYLGNAIDESIEQYREALRLDPGNRMARLNILMPLLETCDWDSAAAEVDWLLARWRTQGDATVYDCISPFLSLLVPVPPEFRLDVARHHALQTARRVAAVPGISRAHDHQRQRLRIGYLSDAFRNHATAHLAAGLFEQHDRERFECFAYSFGLDDGSAYRRRLVDAFEHFVDIRDLSHHAAARRIADDAIDILVDLNGYTAGSRPEIAALRPAPVQVNYLGYPGTMGAPFIDYIVADPTVIPETDVGHYSEQVVWMPASYQPNDNRQPIAGRVARRAEWGLPESFVFCAFNQHVKIERAVFDAWLRILSDTPGSVLWLLAGGGEKRLRLRAAQSGVDPARLVFARLLPKPEHLARLGLADLFLDTYTCNAHTTASDALWAGVPVLTRSSPGFAGRVAASLLKAAGLPELIAPDAVTYERQAIALARDPELLRSFANRLKENRAALPLFDTARYTRSLESAYQAMWARHRSGAGPQSFSVS